MRHEETAAFAAGIVSFGTDLDNPDFGAVATALGMFGRRVERPADLEAALTEAFAYDGPPVARRILN